MRKVVVCGARGRVGSRIVQMIAEDPNRDLTCAAGIDHPFSDHERGIVPLTLDLDAVLKVQTVDVVIEFTNPEVTLNHLRTCVQHHIPLVIGTTGFSTEQREQIEQAAQSIPICLSPNMSVGVNVLYRLVSEAAKLLGEDFDVEVVEAHHRLKKDAPSGTAMKIAEVLLEALERTPKDLCYHREGITGERPSKQIGMQTIRGGDIVGDHTVLFAGLGERIEIRHQATNRDLFAKGAIRAAKWLIDRPAGLYDMQDVLGLR